MDLGRCHDRLGNTGKAFECYEEALHCNFLHKRALVDQGALLLKNEKFNDALKCFDAALQMDPGMRTALDYRQKVLQEMIREGLLKAVPLKAIPAWDAALFRSAPRRLAVIRSKSVPGQRHLVVEPIIKII